MIVCVYIFHQYKLFLFCFVLFLFQLFIKYLNKKETLKVWEKLELSILSCKVFLALFFSSFWLQYHFFHGTKQWIYTIEIKDWSKQFFWFVCLFVFLFQYSLENFISHAINISVTMRFFNIEFLFMLTFRLKFSILYIVLLIDNNIMLFDDNDQFDTIYRFSVEKKSTTRCFFLLINRFLFLFP